MNDGDLAYVRPVRGGPESLAQYRDHDDIDPYFIYFGTDWTDRAERVHVVRHVRLVDQ